MANLSSVITQTVGTSVAGVNLITAPNESSPWTVSTISKSTTTTAAELPLGPAIPTATKFSLAASPGTAYVDVDCPQALTNWCLQLGWFARCSAGFTAAISIASIKSYASTGNRTSDTSGTTITPRNSTIQGTAVSFQTTFDTNSQLYYRITLSFAAQTSAWYSIAQVEVGPGSTEQVTSVSDWVSWTPTGSWVSNATYTGYYMREVSNMKGRVKVALTGAPTATSLSINLPSGLTINTTVLQELSSRSVLGQLSAIDTGVESYPGIVGYSSATALTCNIFTAGGTYADHDPLTQAVPFTFGNGDVVILEFTVPIAEWSGTVGTGRAPDEEWASNGDSSNTSNTSNFVYGRDGSLLLASTPAGTTISKRVRFQSPIQADDEFILEVSDNRTVWFPVPAAVTNFIEVFRYDGTNYIGAGGFSRINTTDVDVYFGKYRMGATNPWSDVAYWRLRKTKKASLPFAKADSSSSGLVAPRKGQYSLTVTSSQAGWATIRAVGLYYQDQDGNHRLKFNIAGTHTSATVAVVTLTLTGVTFKNVSSYFQSVSCFWNSVASITPHGYTSPNASTITLESSSAASCNGAFVSGDVELESKPSWA